jgi:hypothetical protein
MSLYEQASQVAGIGLSNIYAGFHVIQAATRSSEMVDELTSLHDEQSRKAEITSHCEHLSSFSNGR